MTNTKAINDIQHEARAILRGAIAEYDPVAVCGLFSGGNDSTVLIDVVSDFLTHIVHVNTTIGIEETREYVRSMANDHWQIPYIEQQPPISYSDIVLGKDKGYGGGFPGPGAHGWMYRRLKERALRQVRRQFIGSEGRSKRVIFVSGVRIQESSRRFRNVTRAIDREGSTVWVAPLVWWNNDDIREYRKTNPELPRNPASDHLHMSGECLCGAYGSREELEEIAFFFPNAAREIRALEKEMRLRVENGETEIPHERTYWGWAKGSDHKEEVIEEEGVTARLCSSCDYRAEIQEEQTP